MENKIAKSAFITGIPTAGKSCLAKKVSEKIGARHVAIDDYRKEWGKDPALNKWTNLFLNLDEEKYLAMSCDEQWQKGIEQSEGLWSATLEKINEIRDNGQSAIFEAVTILPHLAKRDLNFPGIVLLGESFEKTLERNYKFPRWGKTKELQRREAESFWNCERKHYQSEAEKYGFKSFSDPVAAEAELVKILS